ncbi:hypothetical protein [Actinoplanes oblitus]|uniref:hypothetical protein n=1 Tax=Actinoplanes oblitus TaxID=3040509 RepID=UPI003899404A
MGAHGCAIEAAAPDGAHETRGRLGGVSRQRVYQNTSRGDFPKPVADLEQNPPGQTPDDHPGAATATRRSAMTSTPSPAPTRPPESTSPRPRRTG